MAMTHSTHEGPEPQPAARIAAFEELGFGLFLHWGLYSLLGRGEWVRHRENLGAAGYEALAGQFSAKDFDARAWARLAREAGMGYAVITTRHHDGFSLYDTRGLNDFDAPHAAAGRDLVADFVEGCRAEGIVPFFYHTTLDWRWGSHTCTPADFDRYLEYLQSSVEVLCRHYGEIGGFWFDGNWSRADVDWREGELYAMIRRHQPEAILVNNTGLGARGARGAAELDVTTFEQGVPVPPDRRGWTKYLAVEMCQTINRHWGRAEGDYAFKSLADLIETLAACRAAGANTLLNVGPEAQGGIPELEAALLRRLGAWLQGPGHPFAGGRPRFVARSREGRDIIFERDGRLLAALHDVPVGGSGNVIVDPRDPSARPFPAIGDPISAARWLDTGEPFPVASDADGAFRLHPTPQRYGTDSVVRVAELERAGHGTGE